MPMVIVVQCWACGGPHKQYECPEYEYYGYGYGYGYDNRGYNNRSNKNSAQPSPAQSANNNVKNTVNLVTEPPESAEDQGNTVADVDNSQRPQHQN